MKLGSNVPAKRMRWPGPERPSAGATAAIRSPATATVRPSSTRVPSNTRSAAITYRSPNRRCPGWPAAGRACSSGVVMSGRTFRPGTRPTGTLQPAVRVGVTQRWRFQVDFRISPGTKVGRPLPRRRPYAATTPTRPPEAVSVLSPRPLPARDRARRGTAAGWREGADAFVPKAEGHHYPGGPPVLPGAGGPAPPSCLMTRRKDSTRMRHLRVTPGPADRS